MDELDGRILDVLRRNGRISNRDLAASVNLSPSPCLRRVRRLEKSGVQGKLGPKMNEEKDPEYWYAKAEKDGNIAPQRKLANEKPQGVTIDYDELLKTWKAPAPHKKG